MCTETKKEKYAVTFSSKEIIGFPDEINKVIVCVIVWDLCIDFLSAFTHFLVILFAGSCVWWSKCWNFFLPKKSSSRRNWRWSNWEKSPLVGSFEGEGEVKKLFSLIHLCYECNFWPKSPGSRTDLFFFPLVQDLMKKEILNILVCSEGRSFILGWCTSIRTGVKVSCSNNH